MLTDLRHVLRGLRRAPAFACAAVLTLAIGIGANVAVYALIDAVLFRPLSPHEPDRLVRVGSAIRGVEQSTRFSFNWADSQQIARGSRALAEVTASTLTPFVLRSGEDSSQILGEIVSGSYFPMLRTTTARGRLLLARDDEAGAAPAAVISRRAEERFFAGREALGATIFLNNRPFTVVGVAPATFGGTFIAAPIDAWIPIEASELFFARDWRTARGQAMFTLLARLAPGVTRARAQAELDAIAADIARRDPAKADTQLQVADGGLLRGAQRRGAVMFALVLSALVGLVLIIVCANVGNLLLARGIGLRRQMAIRIAMGARRARLIRLVMTESLVLAALAAAGALGLAALAVPALSTFNPLPTLSLDLQLRVDGPVIAAAGLLALLAGAVLGILPALHASKPEVQAVLREESGTVAGGRRIAWIRGALAVAQIALSLLLLATAGLFGRSLANARQLDLGFEPDHGAAVDVDVAPRDVSTPADAHRLFDELARRLHARPEVSAVAFSNRAPVDNSTPLVDVITDGRPVAPGSRPPQATMYWASPEYFDAVSVPILQGRAFRDTDTLEAPRVAIVNQTLARRFWPAGDAIGRRFRTAAGEPPVEIVGIAGDSRYRSLGEEPQPHVYLPFAQTPGPTATVIVRTNGDPRPLVPMLQAEIDRMPQLSGFFARTLRDHLAIYVLPSELAAAMSAVLGAVAMLVAAVGLYGLIAYMVGQRTREIAIRMALGASARQIRTQILQSGLRLLVPGLVAGILGSLAVGQAAAGLLYGVGPADPLTMGAAAAVLAAVVMAASYVPAVRAMRVDPAVALRR